MGLQRLQHAKSVVTCWICLYAKLAMIQRVAQAVTPKVSWYQVIVTCVRLLQKNASLAFIMWRFQRLIVLDVLMDIFLIPCPMAKNIADFVSTTSITAQTVYLVPVWVVWPHTLLIQTVNVPYANPAIPKSANTVWTWPAVFHSLLCKISHKYVLPVQMNFISFMIKNLRNVIVPLDLSQSMYLAR